MPTAELHFGSPLMRRFSIGNLKRRNSLVLDVDSDRRTIFAMQTNLRSNVISGHKKGYELNDRNLSPPRQETASDSYCSLSWNSILAGVVMALIVHLVLALFGMGMDIQGSPSAVTSIGIIIWQVIAGVASALAAGFTAGHLSGNPKEAAGGWHGLMSWATSILILCILMMTIGSLAGGPYKIMMDALRERSVASAPDNAIAAESLLSAIMLTLGAIAAWFGGCLGTIKPKPATRKIRMEGPLH